MVGVNGMTDMIETKARLAHWESALEKLRAAYLSLIDGGVKSYTIDDRTLTKFDLPALRDEIAYAEKQVDTLTSQMRGGSPRKAFGVIPRDW